jgi:hypothetical protein
MSELRDFFRQLPRRNLVLFALLFVVVVAVDVATRSYTLLGVLVVTLVALALFLRAKLRRR